MIDSTSAITLVVVGITLLYIWWKYITRKGNETIVFAPGSWPLLGHVPAMIETENFRKLCDKWHQEFDGTFGLYLMSNKLVVTSNLQVIEDYLSSQKYITKSPLLYDILKTFFGEALFASRDSLWRERRRLLTPAFHFDILSGFVQMIEKKSVEFTKLLSKFAKDGTTFDASVMTKHFSMAVICETVMGKVTYMEDMMNNSDEEFKNLYENAIYLMMKRFYRPWLQVDWIYYKTVEGKLFHKQKQTLRKYVKELIEERIEFRQDNSQSDGTMKNSKRKIFIDVLLDAYQRNEIDIDGIIDESSALIFAGFDTTASTIAFALYRLARNKACQEKLYQEIRDLLDHNSQPTITDIQKLKYLDCVIKETMRLDVVVNSFQRSIKKGTVLAGKVFPECSLAVDLRIVNHNPENWANPLSFIPERFENFDKRSSNKRYLFIPFSVGPRNCIGKRFAMMEMKIALFHLVDKFVLMSDRREEDLQMTYEGVNSSLNGIPINLKERTL